LAEQQLVDCARNFVTYGCGGGLPSHAYTYAYYNGIMLESDYPYQAKEGVCKYDPTKTAVSVFGSFNITELDEPAMEMAVANVGPVTISFTVESDFKSYAGGVYDNKNCRDTIHDVNHDVQIVGYGTDNGIPYWTVKNSWGQRFGEQGYFKIRRGVNRCGLASCSAFPVGVHPFSH